MSPEAPRPGERLLSLIDLGTNSIRLDLVALGPDGPRRLHREKRMVRLGDGLFEDGRPSQEAVARVELALEDFAGLHQAYSVQRVRAVATAAMREAPNAAGLAADWEQRFGIHFEVISGAQEAALIARGVLAAEHPPAGAYALIDIGGGSVELSLCQGLRAQASCSLPLGANRLQQRCLRRQPPLAGGVEALRRECREALNGPQGVAAWPRVREMIGSGGTVRALRKIAKAAKVKDQPFTLHFLRELSSRMERLDRTTLMHLPGMDAKRSDLILAGALVLEEACLALGATRIRATEATLRDGLLQDELAPATR
jgi:exopolyphosphatase/guanosine-5'-triphosphate,3'-diphosphate pyrophosphatase